MRKFVRVPGRPRPTIFLLTSINKPLILGWVFFPFFRLYSFLQLPNLQTINTHITWGLLTDSFHMLVMWCKSLFINKNNITMGLHLFKSLGN